MDNIDFETLIEFLEKVPSIKKPILTGEDDGFWWIKFTVDINHKLSWNLIQEFGHILNYLSIDERLPTVFYPVSPPPYMNGGPDYYLSWIIETKDKEFKPEILREWLEGRLPDPVNDEKLWNSD